MTPQKHKQQDKQLFKQHRRRQQAEVSGGGGDASCDESKCVSTGLSYQRYNDSFTCYTNINYPTSMMCADGFKPRIVESEPTALFYGDVLQYFTCCPPGLSVEANVNRHCSDPTTNFETNDNNSTSMVCDDDESLPYPRQMKTNKNFTLDDPVSLYVCFD